MKKKLFSILLSLAMMVTMMPAMTMTAFADTDITEITLNYDDSCVKPGLTPAEIQAQLGIEVIGNASLQGFHIQSNSSGQLSSDEPLIAGEEYYFDFTLSPNSGYVFNASNGPNTTVNGHLYIYDQSRDYLSVEDYKLTVWSDYFYPSTDWGKLKSACSGDNVSSNNAFTVSDSGNTRTITLQSDITATSSDSALVVPSGATVVLDLHGHTIDRNLATATDDGYVIKVEGNLTIKDSNGNGKITGGYNSGHGGAINVGGGAQVNVLGGSIENNHSVQSGGAVQVDGSFTMSGGKIRNNQADKDGGGLSINGTTKLTGTAKILNNTASTGTGGGINYYGGSLTLGGSVQITGNVKGGIISGGVLTGGTTNNVCQFYSSQFISFGTGENAPTSGMQVGITTQTTPTEGSPVKFTTNGTAGDLQYFFSDKSAYYVNYNNSGYFELKTPATGNYAINVIPSEHGTVSASVQEASENASITLTVTPDSGYELSANGLKVTSAGGTVIHVSADSGNTYTFTMPAAAVTVTATFIETETPPTPPTPTPDPTPAEEYTVPVESENTVQVEATVDKGKAAVKEITKEIIEEVTKPTAGKEKADAIVIDLSKAKQDVTAVELTSKTVENLAEAVASKDNAVEKVTIQMAEATVELDAKTLETVSKEAKGDTIKLVVDKTKEESLKPSQKETLSKFDVNKTFEAYFESNGQRISNFSGGKVVLKIKFTPENGKNSNNYKVWYVGEDGKIEKYASKYENGFLVFTTSHFSDYAIVYEGTNDVLLLKAKTFGNKAIKLSWNGIDNATKYVVYGAKCGNDYKKLKTVKGKSYTVKKISGKKLIAHKAYKFYVVAYDAVGNQVKSKSIHFVTANTQGKYANVKSIKAKYDELLLSVGVTQKIGATYKMYSGKKHIPKSHGTALRYISNNSDVATVTKSGTVKAVGKGTATIYIQDIGGKYCKTKVTVE